MLQDILDQFDIENNFDYCFSMYCNFLEREKCWNLCEGNNTKNNFKYRMRRVHKGDLDKSKEYKKFELWIEKRREREQKEAEMRAIKINRQYRDKCEKIEEQLQEKQEQLKLLQEKHDTLLNKYLAECDSDSD